MGEKALDLKTLNCNLDGQNQDYWLHLQADTKLDKYPAKQHARSVATKLGVENGLIFLNGEKTALMADSDQPVPFRQRRYFYYLTGCTESDCSVLYDIAKDLLTLYIPKVDLRHAVWGGAGSTKSEAYAKYDVDAVQFTSEASKDVRRWAIQNQNNSAKLFFNPGTARDDNVVAGIFHLEKENDKIDPTSLKSAIELCRVIKYPHEVELIRRANQISAKAHRAVLENIRHFKNEREIEGIFLDTCISAGAHNQAYEIIAGSGTNAAVLHYVANNASLEDKQVVLLDAGAEVECYASDVTRTFPISGHWSEEAANIYDAVNDMQAQCIARIRPGVHYRDLQILSLAIAARWLLKLGVLHNGTLEEILKAGTMLAFFPHGLGHHVGLDVHDVLHVPIQSKIAAQEQSPNMGTYQGTELAGFSQATFTELYQTLIDPMVCKPPVTVDSPVLEENMVVTVEPGIYFSQFALSKVYLRDPKHAKFIDEEVLAKYLPVGGVRIEDDILVTSNGYVNLTTAPKGDEALKIIRGDGDEVASSVLTSGINPNPAPPAASQASMPTNKGKAPIRLPLVDLQKIMNEDNATKGWTPQLTEDLLTKCSADVKQKVADVLPPRDQTQSLFNAFPFGQQTSSIGSDVGWKNILRTVVNKTQEHTQHLLVCLTMLQPQAMQSAQSADSPPLETGFWLPADVRAMVDELVTAQMQAQKNADVLLARLQLPESSAPVHTHTSWQDSMEILNSAGSPTLVLSDTEYSSLEASPSYKMILDVLKITPYGSSGISTVEIAAKSGVAERTVRSICLVMQQQGIARGLPGTQSNRRYELTQPCQPAPASGLTSQLSTAAEVVSSQPIASSSQSATVISSPQLARALYDFDGEGDSGCVQFKKGDILEIITKQSSGWWDAKHTGSGHRGWLPATYVTELPLNDTTTGAHDPLASVCTAPTENLANPDFLVDEQANIEQIQKAMSQQRLRSVFSKELATHLNWEQNTETIEHHIQRLLESTDGDLICFAGLCMQLKLLDPRIDFSKLQGNGMRKFQGLYIAIDGRLKLEFGPFHVFHRMNTEARDALMRERWLVTGVKEEDTTREEFGICGACQICRVGFAHWDEIWLADNVVDDEDDE